MKMPNVDTPSVLYAQKWTPGVHMPNSKNLLEALIGCQWPCNYIDLNIA